MDGKWCNSSRNKSNGWHLQAILKKQKIETKTIDSNSISLIGLKSIYKNYIFYEKINNFNQVKN